MPASADESMDVRLADGTVYPFMGFLIIPGRASIAMPGRLTAESRMTVLLCPGCYALTTFPSAHHHQAHGVNKRDSSEDRRGVQIGDNNTQTNTF